MAENTPHPSAPPAAKPSTWKAVDTLKTWLHVVVQHAIPYWAVLGTNKAEFTWAVDDELKKPVSSWSIVDLRKGDTDATVPFRWITDLQEDLASFGFRRVLRQKDGSIGHPSGVFDVVCERTVRYFQNAAKKLGSFEGEINGVVDDATKREIRRWKVNKIRRSLREYDKQSLLKGADMCPELVTRLRAMEARFDALDLELYGPGNTLDAFRSFATQTGIPSTNTSAGAGESPHNYGCAVDQDFWSPNKDASYLLEPEGGDKYAMPEERMAYGVLAESVGLSWGGRWTRPYDPRHVEYVPPGLASGASNHFSGARALAIFNATKGDARAKIRAVWTGGVVPATPAAAPAATDVPDIEPTPQPAPPSAFDLVGGDPLGADDGRE